jgi:hypothetical protein
VSDPLARFGGSPPHEGEITSCNVRALFSPSVRGRAAEGGRGSLTHRLDLELGNTPAGRGSGCGARMSPRRGETIFRRYAAIFIVE